MKQTLEEAAREHQNGFQTYDDESVLCAFSNGMHHQSYKSFIAGAEWHAKQSIEVLSSVLENWVHGGDADCIIAEFEEKLNNK